MSFSHPVCLALLPLVLLLFRRPRVAALPYPETRIFDGLVTGRARWVTVSRKGLQIIVLLSLILAAAGPRWPDGRTRLPSEGISIVIVLDVSGSMEAASFSWKADEKPISRAEAALRAFHLFVVGGNGPDGKVFPGRSTEKGTDAIGLVTFALVPYPVCPPTLHHPALLKALDDVKPRGVLDAGTNIGDALTEGLILLRRAPTERRALILLSDGEHNFERDDVNRKPLKPKQAAQLAANLKIPIYTIDTGGDPDPDATADEIKQRRDGRLVNEAIARRTGGRAFTANDGAELLKACAELDGLERQDVLSFNYRRYFEMAPELIGMALSGLLFLFVMDRTFWRVLG